MKKLILIFVLIIGIAQIINAQEAEEWKTQTFVTGYFALNGEYVGLPVFEEVKGQNFGVGIAEASILSTIRPLEKLKISSVLTYKPRLNIDGIIVELSGEWTFSELLKIKIGRFLLPLHPANTQYYAPMNFSVALPIIVTNRALFPININGINLNGNIPLNDNLSIDYNFSGGQYTKLSRVEAGILGFSGRDGVYFNSDVQIIRAMITKLENSQTKEFPNYFGAGGKLGLKISDIANFEIAAFYGAEEISMQANPTTVIKTDLEFLTYGANFIVDYNNLHIKASAWFGKETPDDAVNFVTYNNKFYYSEIAYKIGNISPFLKFEDIQARKNFTRMTAGINYRPFFETTFKVEYHRYLQDYVANFDVLMFSAIYSF